MTNGTTKPVLRLLLPLLLLCLLPLRAWAETEFLNDKAFSYGMSQEDAAKMIYGDKHGKDWEIAYDVATTSTWEIACRHHEEVQYVVRFYEGTCIYVEKRAEIDGRDVEKTISKIFDVNGETAEAAGNTGESQFFARWTHDDRTIELMAMRRRGGKFLLSYQDADLGRVNEAMLIRDREIKQGRMVIDPLTGKPMPHVETGEQAANSGAEDGGSAEDQPKQDGEDPK